MSVLLLVAKEAPPEIIGNEEGREVTANEIGGMTPRS